MDLARTAPRHVVVAGEANAPDTRALVRAFNQRFLPNDLLLLTGGAATRQRLARLAPFTASLEPHGGKATAYVCQRFVCRLPVTGSEELRSSLEPRGP